MKKRLLVNQLFFVFLLMAAIPTQAGFWDYFSMPSRPNFSDSWHNTSTRFSSLFSAARPHATTIGSTSAGFLSGGIFGWFFGRRQAAAQAEQARRQAEEQQQKAEDLRQKSECAFLNNVCHSKWTQANAEKMATKMGFNASEEFKDSIGDRVTAWYNAERLRDQVVGAENALQHADEQNRELQNLNTQLHDTLRTAQEYSTELEGAHKQDEDRLGAERDKSLRLQGESAKLQEQCTQISRELSNEKDKSEELVGTLGQANKMLDTTFSMLEKQSNQVRETAGLLEEVQKLSMQVEIEREREKKELKGELKKAQKKTENVLRRAKEGTLYEQVGIQITEPPAAQIERRKKLTSFLNLPGTKPVPNSINQEEKKTRQIFYEGNSEKISLDDPMLNQTGESKEESERLVSFCKQRLRDIDDPESSSEKGKQEDLSSSWVMLQDKRGSKHSVRQKLLPSLNNLIQLEWQKPRGKRDQNYLRALYEDRDKYLFENERYNLIKRYSRHVRGNGIYTTGNAITNTFVRDVSGYSCPFYERTYSSDGNIDKHDAEALFISYPGTGADVTQYGGSADSKDATGQLVKENSKDLIDICQDYHRKTGIKVTSMTVGWNSQLSSYWRKESGEVVGSVVSEKVKEAQEAGKKLLVYHYAHSFGGMVALIAADVAKQETKESAEAIFLMGTPLGSELKEIVKKGFSGKSVMLFRNERDSIHAIGEWLQQWAVTRRLEQHDELPNGEQRVRSNVYNVRVLSDGKDVKHSELKYAITPALWNIYKRASRLTNRDIQVNLRGGEIGHLASRHKVTDGVPTDAENDRLAFEANRYAEQYGKDISHRDTGAWAAVCDLNGDLRYKRSKQLKQKCDEFLCDDEKEEEPEDGNFHIGSFESPHSRAHKRSLSWDSGRCIGTTEKGHSLTDPTVSPLADFSPLSSPMRDYDLHQQQRALEFKPN